MNVVIVGASRGIGADLSAWLTTEGHNVFRISRSSGCNATNRRQLTTTRDCQVTWTHVDALICCAARHGPIEKALLCGNDWVQAFADNVACTLLPIQVFGRMLRLAEDPKVICFSGGGATQARPMFSSYGCAKTAIVRLVETIAAEEPWLDINAVAPGAIATEMTREIQFAENISGEEREEARGAAIHRPARLKKLFACVDWLLSKESDGISGRLIAAQHDDYEDFLLPDLGYLRRTELG